MALPPSKALTHSQRNLVGIRIAARCLADTKLAYTVQDHRPRHGTTHSGKVPPIPINNQDNAPQKSPQANLI